MEERLMLGVTPMARFIFIGAIWFAIEQEQ